MTRHLLDIDDLSPAELKRILELSEISKSYQAMDGMGVAMVFEKPSARTRNATEMAAVQVGAHPVYITGAEIGFGVRETVEDVTRTLCGYYDVIAARVMSHTTLERMCAVSSVPVINLLSDRAHPMQALADVLTLNQEFESLDRIVVAYVGDANNVARSLAKAATKLGMTMRVASPAGYSFAEGDLADVELYDDPVEAVTDAHCVYTDVWTSMGQEAETEQRRLDFTEFQVNGALMEHTADNAIFLHCLPANRGEEVTDEVIDSAASRVWQQAENRMHAARGVLLWMFGEDNAGNGAGNGPVLANRPGSDSGLKQ